MYALIDFLAMAGDCLTNEDEENKESVKDIVNADLIQRVICVMLKQLCERIDRVRLVSGALL